jgi:hypothetical protein
LHGKESTTARIQALEDELARLTRQRQAERDDAFLRALARSIGAVRFTSSDLVDAARFDPELRVALGLLARSPRRLGKRLRALASRRRPGVWLERCGRGDDGCMRQLHLPSAADDTDVE